MSFMSGVASAFGSIGGLLNGLTGVTESQDRTYAQQRKSMNDQNAYNTYMWNLQNQYNSPTAQLARMREAGIDINPTSYALGTGNLSNTATFVGSENGFSGSGSPAGNPITMALGVANGIANVQNTKAQTNNIIAQEDYTSEHARRLKNDNDFFEQFGYYPTVSDTPIGSGVESSFLKDIFSAMSRGYQNYEKRNKK